MTPLFPSHLTTLLVVAGGGALGAALRYEFGYQLLRLLPQHLARFPWATLGVNILGSLLLGIIAGLMSMAEQPASPLLRSFVIVGVLGGFTTFSSFSMDFILLVERGDWPAALSYAALSFGGGILGFFLAMRGISFAFAG